jgi:hypothetical protein
MGLMVDFDDLAGVTELAREHGVAHSCMMYWVDLPTFPAPLGRLGLGRIWSRKAVAVWVAQRPVNPERGRPQRKRPRTTKQLAHNELAKITSR